VHFPFDFRFRESETRHRSEMESKFENTIFSKSKELGQLISSALFDQASSVARDDDNFLQSRLSVVAQMLCISEHSGAQQEREHNSDSARTSELLHDACRQISNVILPSTDGGKFLNDDESVQVFANRNQAIDDLHATIRLFNEELQSPSSKN
jgi:hypothetical protein